MINNEKKRLAIVILLVVVLLVYSGVLIQKDQYCCMSVPVVSETFFSKLYEDMGLPIPELMFNGVKIASGEDLTEIYISQPADSIQHYSELYGKLTSSDPQTSLYFIKNTAIENIQDAVSSGTPISLAIKNGKAFRKLNVIITSLPVMYISSPDVSGGEIWYGSRTGRITLFGKTIFSSGNYQIASRDIQWHLRGASSLAKPKKAYKLSLKDKTGNDSDADLLGLGLDDDWILNPMSFDDTKVREKFAMDFWNKYISKESITNMSSGEYVEVIINNQYGGLYLLQRRIDQKYLKIDYTQDILFKGDNIGNPNSIEEEYEVVYSPYDQEQTYRIISDVLSLDRLDKIDIRQFVEVGVFLEYLAAADNKKSRNTFYLLQKDSENYKMTIIPWDTDMSMGVTWIDGFTYDYRSSLNEHIRRQEHELLTRLNPQLESEFVSYWQQARKQIYSEKIIHSMLAENMMVICNSGAYQRDVQLWGSQYNGLDTHETLLDWCSERLSILDGRYAYIQ